MPTKDEIKYNYIDLFHGIGGFAVGAYWAGMKFENHYCSDIEPYAVELYKKRFPDSIQLGDIREIDCEKLMADTEGERCREAGEYKSERNKERSSVCGNWIITGGFPCQDISLAGKGTGIRGHRSGLWFEMWRIIRDLRPRFAIMENVGALTFRGLTDVLGSLAEIGYDAEWQDIRAEDMGAPHRRERIWIVAYPSIEGLQERKESKQSEVLSYVKRRGTEISNAFSLNDDNGRHGTGEICRQRSEQTDISGSKEISDSSCKLQYGFREPRSTGGKESANGNWWQSEPAVGRLAHGVSGRVDRLKGLGNSIVPQIAELLFKQIKEQI